MPFFDGAVGRVYYRHWPAARPRAGLVFLHGFGEHSGLYHRFAAALDSYQISVWALDEVGHGLSEGPRGRIDSLDDLVHNAALLTDIASEVDPGLPLVLAGHSLGGTVAALVATRDPTRYAGVVLSGTPISPLAWVAALPPDGRLSLDPGELSADPGYLDALTHDPLAFTEAEAVFPVRPLTTAWRELDTRLPDLRLPVLFVHGGEDRIVPAEDNRAWSRRLTLARITAFPDARHDVINETVHREVAASVAEFVLDVTARSAA